MKSESPTATPAPQPQEPATTSATTATSAPKIKQENPQYGMENRPDNRLTPCLTPGPMATAPSPSVAPQTIQPRFLTPCSEMMGSPPSLGTPPPSLSTPSSFDYSQPPYTGADGLLWPQTVHYDHYPNPYAFAFDAGPCDSPNMHYGLNHPSIETDGEYIPVDVKYEHEG